MHLPFFHFLSPIKYGMIRTVVPGVIGDNSLVHLSYCIFYLFTLLFIYVCNTLALVGISVLVLRLNFFCAGETPCPAVGVFRQPNKAIMGSSRVSFALISICFAFFTLFSALPLAY